ncbi:T9SS type A sorting domain-containing protein [Winogradskyella poriferorum]|uniref:T9SS type A sorting domain-containing protein n=1 Tax=Winogradskyella poriferorum TaxID=307627 RepID=A0ABU7W0X4_9FLAO
MRQIYLILTLCFTLTFICNGQTLGVDTFTLGNDDSDNYGGSWNATNLGTGFSDWTFDQATPNGGFAGRFIGTFSSAIDVNGNSFAMYANSGNDAVSGATTYMPKAMEEGDSFTVSVGVNFRDGNKGFDLRDGSNNTIINFNIGSDQYNITGTSGLFSNAYDANTVITFTFTQNTNSISWTANRSGGLTGSESGTISSINSGTITNIRFYNVSAGTNGDGGSGQRNLFINSLNFESTYTIAENTTVNVTTSETVPYLSIENGSTVNVTKTGNLEVSGNLNNIGSLILNSDSDEYSSLIVDGTATGNVVYNRHVNSNDPVNGNDLISAPLSGQAFNVFIANNTNILTSSSGPEVLFGDFDNDNASAPYQIWNDTDTTPLLAGIGYRSGIEIGAPTNLVSFEGIVNTSLVEVAIDQGSASILNLVGNPFPSYLDAQAFLTQNAALLDPSAVVIYGYNDSTDGTSADDYTIISALENNTLNIAPGQGFFVASNPLGGNLQFTTSTPDMRLTSTDDDFIAGRSTSSAVTNVNINLSNSTDSFLTKVYFTASAGLGLDPGYDASLLGGVAPSFAIFSHLVEDNINVPFATQAIGETDYNDTTIALGVNANMGEQLTFSITENTLPTSIEVYLDDTFANTSTLLNTSDYIFTPAANLNGTGRFYLRFSNSALSVSDHLFDGVSIYTNPNNKTINIAGQLAEGTSAYLHDIQGRLVNSKALESNSTLHSIDANNLHTGVYIVKLVNGTILKTEKVILK